VADRGKSGPDDSDRRQGGRDEEGQDQGGGDFDLSQFEFSNGSGPVGGDAQAKPDQQQAEQQTHQEFLKEVAELGLSLREGVDQTEAPPVDVDLIRRYAYGQLNKQDSRRIFLLRMRYSSWNNAYINVLEKKNLEEN
jgi:hypothetical protein